MLKTKYQRMNKQEKKELLQEYKESAAGKEMMKRLGRLQGIGGIGILYALYLLICSIKDLKVYDFCIIVPLFLISVFFIFMAIHLKKKVLNRFAIKENKKVSK